MSKLKVYTNEKGHSVVNLPVAGVELAFRSPKGKDLKHLELASKADDATNVGMMLLLASMLCVKYGAASGLSIEDAENMDADDVLALGEALSSFRAFRNLSTR